MTLRDDIFPSGPLRDGTIIRAQLVETWESQLLGLGRLTAFLTERLEKESFAIDDMALYVVFLQRHRVEVGLKLILERAGASIPTTHKLEPLLQACKTAVEAAGFTSEGQRFASAQASYVQLVAQIDPGAATFRYPVDTAQQPWARDEYVDLDAFERAGAGFRPRCSIWSRISPPWSRSRLMPLTPRLSLATCGSSPALAVARQTSPTTC
jgi:hypothetical protein